VSTGSHGLAPKLPGDATKFLNGAGGFTNPFAQGSFTWTSEYDPDAGRFTLHQKAASSEASWLWEVPSVEDGTPVSILSLQSGASGTYISMTGDIYATGSVYVNGEQVLVPSLARQSFLDKTA